MGGLKVIWEGQSRGGTFLSGLGVFCTDSVTACLSSDADKLCVPIGLSALSALLLLLSCVVLVYQRCKVRGENPGEAVTSFYCFLGNLCSAIGAVLSKQLDIQVLMGAFAAAVDVVNFISIFFPICLCWNSKAERRLRTMKRRRRQHLLSVSVLMVLGGGYLTSRIGPRLADRPLNGRRLLHAHLQDNTEILGYVLGLLSLVIACTSKLPALSGARRREMVTRARVFSGVLCSLAGVLYASSILLYDSRFEFALRAMPWLLSSLFCATLDLLILVIYWCRRGTRQHPQRFSPDTESLLGGSATPAKDNPAMKRHRKQQVCLTEVSGSREEALENQPLKTTVREVRCEGLCFSDSSYDSVSSDLEWDFEEANTQWREPPAKPKTGDEFPLQDWPKNPKPFGVCTCGVPGLPEETVCGEDVGESGSR